MIRKAHENDKASIYRMWKEMFAQDDNGYTDYYFECLFQCENTWVVEEDGEIISTLQRNPHIMYFHGKAIRTSMILGVATLPSRRNEGHMHSLMKEALKEAEAEEMISWSITRGTKIFFFLTTIPVNGFSLYITGK